MNHPEQDQSTFQNSLVDDCPLSGILYHSKTNFKIEVFEMSKPSVSELKLTNILWTFSTQTYVNLHEKRHPWIERSLSSHVWCAGLTAAQIKDTRSHQAVIRLHHKISNEQTNNRPYFCTNRTIQQSNEQAAT